MGGNIGGPKEVVTRKTRVGIVPVLGALLALGLAGFGAFRAEPFPAETTNRPSAQLLVLADQAATPSKNLDRERLNAAPTLAPAQVDLVAPLQLEPISDGLGSSPATTNPSDSSGSAATSNAPSTASPTESTEASSSPPPTDSALSQAPTTSTPPTTIARSPEAVGESALRLVSYPWQERLPGWTISFLPGRSGLYGLTLTTEKRIEIYVRDDQSPQLLAHVIAHELGHAVDVSLNDGPDRRRWQEARGIGSSPWWPGNGATDFSTGAGDFAESFAAWQVGNASFRSKVGGPPTAEHKALLADLSGG